MKIPEGQELLTQAAVAVFVFVVCAVILFIAFSTRSPAVQLVAVVSTLGLVFLIGLRLGARAPGDPRE
jgi:hypothetical protein